MHVRMTRVCCRKSRSGSPRKGLAELERQGAQGLPQRAADRLRRRRREGGAAGPLVPLRSAPLPLPRRAAGLVLGAGRAAPGQRRGLRPVPGVADARGAEGDRVPCSQPESSRFPGALAQRSVARGPVGPSHGPQAHELMSPCVGLWARV